MDHRISIITKSAQETTRLGRKIGHSFLTEPQGDIANVTYLFGEMGSGKTTFVQGLAQGLGISGRLLSPTFIIVRRYDLKKNYSYFYHIDLYRLTRFQEFASLGLAEILSDKTVIVAIEWAEKLKNFVPKRTDIHFKALKDSSRQIQVTHNSTFGYE